MECKKRPDIEYPCHWSYKVIGLDKILVRQAAELVMETREYLLQYSKSSTKGKFHSWHLELVVCDEEERNNVYRLLKDHPDVVMVI